MVKNRSFDSLHRSNCMFRTYDGPCRTAARPDRPADGGQHGSRFHSGWSLFGQLCKRNNILPAVIGFGCLAGTGFGLGYSAATPAAVKCSPEKKGLITGIVVSGFGLAPVYIAPFSKFLITDFASTTHPDFGCDLCYIRGIYCSVHRQSPAQITVPSQPKARSRNDGEISHGERW